MTDNEPNTIIDERKVITEEIKPPVNRVKIFSYFILFLLICLVLLAGYCLYLDNINAHVVNDCNEFWQDQFDKKCGGSLYDENFESTPGMVDPRTIPTD